MSHLPERSTHLSARKQALLQIMLQEEGVMPTAQQKIPRRTDAGWAQLSFAQQRLWFLDQLEPMNPFYNLSAVIRLSGYLNLPALLSSFETVLRRHASLRTRFALVDGKAVQIINDQASFPFSLICLQALTLEIQEATLLELVNEEGRHPFNLAAGELFRCLLLQISPQEQVLTLTLHHIITDGWSMGVLVRECLELYQAFRAGKPSSLPALPIQYADYAVWQRGWLQGKVLEEQMGYWHSQLTGAPPLLEIPSDYPRPPVQSYRGNHLTLTVSPALTALLEELSQREGATLFMTLLATFQVLLSRYSGQEDIVVGTPVANRTHRETEALIGFFVNTLLMRTNLSGQPTFQEVVRRVREVCLGAYAHQDLPFEKLVEELQPVRNLSYAPLFQVFFALQNAPMPAVTLGELQAQVLEIGGQTAKFDLAMSITPTKEGLGVDIEYNTDLFAASTMERLAQHFQALLESVVAHPEQAISQLAMLSVAERQNILVDWNATEVEIPQNACIQQCFEAQVELTPDAIAVVYEDLQVTYQELNQRANGVAHFLRTQGVGPDVLVGIGMERSLELVVGLLAILKAGGGYIPLDPKSPIERLVFMVTNSNILLLLTCQSVQARFASSPVVVITLEDLPVSNQLDNPVTTISPDNLVYLIYTSGSTGSPKGAMNTHRALYNRIQWMQQQYLLTGTDRVLQKTPFNFDVSVWEFFWTLTSGAMLVMARPEGHKDPKYLRDIIQQIDITTLHFVPSMLQAFLDEPGIKQCHSLKRVFSSGEALTVDIQNRYFSFLEAELHNLYGPTEAAIDVAYWQCQREADVVPIGRPIANTQLYILDTTLQPIPPLVSGMLYIGGTGVGRGYFQDPSKTADLFIPDPFSRTAGQRLYRTGDIARYRWDGTIEFLGRVDYQVKIRGFRIEPGEVETILLGHPQIQRCLVVALSSPQQTKALVAYVVWEPGEEMSLADLRRWLSASLPEWMLPAALVSLPVFTLTTNGKIDRKALPSPDWQFSHSQRKYTPPQTPVEALLVPVWEQVLGIEGIGIDDPFFEMGGHSLLAIQLLARLRAMFRVELPIVSLFEEPTIAGIAAALKKHEPRPGHLDRVIATIARLQAMSVEEKQELLRQRREKEIRQNDK